MDGADVLAWLEGVEAGEVASVDGLPGEVLWVVVGLHRHLARQAWVGEVVGRELGGELAAIGEIGAFGHPEELPQYGEVPGLVGWRYFFHGMGCCLTGPDGVRLDVDFVEGGTSTIDVYFYLDFLASLRSPEPVEARVLALFPSREGLVLAVDWLEALGLVSRDYGRVQLEAEVLGLGGALERLAARVDDALDRGPSEAWLARLRGLVEAGGFDGAKALACLAELRGCARCSACDGLVEYGCGGRER